MRQDMLAGQAAPDHAQAGQREPAHSVMTSVANQAEQHARARKPASFF